MKGIVFSAKNQRIEQSNNVTLSYKYTFNLRYYFKRYGVFILFFGIFILGIAFGGIFSQSITSKQLKSLDFVFLSNLPQRLNSDFLHMFCASFASDFLFLLIAVLLGLTLWGIGLLPFVVFIKGLGIGIVSAYLISEYSITGFLFYLLILLPGMIIFSIVLIYQAVNSYSISKKLIRNIYSKDSYSLSLPIVLYLKKSLVYSLITLLASLVDTLLWIFFAGFFKL